MSNRTLNMPPALRDYLLEKGTREPAVLRRLREETARLESAVMQVAPEQGQLLHFLTRLIGARGVLEIGVYTGYSSLCMAMALPEDGRLVACDISEEWTAIARRYWREAGVERRIDLRLVRPGGLIAIDNVFWSASVIDPQKQDDDTRAIRRLNDRIASDQRVEVAMIPIADGLTLVSPRQESAR